MIGGHFVGDIILYAWTIAVGYLVFLYICGANACKQLLKPKGYSSSNTVFNNLIYNDSGLQNANLLYNLKQSK